MSESTRHRNRVSFRRLIRISIAAQVVVLCAVLAVAVFGALATVSSSDQLKAHSNDALLLRGTQQEFQRSRIALREYVNTGNAFKLGPFTQSRGQIVLIAASLGAGLDDATQRRLDRYVASIDSYLDEIGEGSVRLMRNGQREAASELLNGQVALERLRAIDREGRLLQATMFHRQREAERSVEQRQFANVALIGLAGLMILGGGLAVVLWIRRELMLPLDELATASRSLGHGDLSARVEPRGVEEVAVAATAFNQMGDEVQQQVQQLHELSAERSRFVSSVSHELRTPITSLRGYLELLADGEAGPLAEDQLNYIQIAERNARQLDDLINDLLTLSRIQSGRFTVNPEPVDIRAILRELKTEMLLIARERKIDIVLVDTGDLIVSGDPLRLKQAFGNLISNAIKYSPDGQAVVIRAFRVNRQVVVSVVDWGKGIPEHELSQLAEPFFRSSATTGIPGTGLGLPIAKQMIEMHGGRLAVESDFGAGTTFTAYLPLHDPTMPANGLGPVRGEAAAADPTEPASGDQNAP